ncbi:T9SS type A sorting domain-containing protein [Chryseobacterium sp. JK1]|uniref:T9SS type A sorting domain-containing protein n=1 Tax=Chryseobacterium sp. JK1 TaxID=874294 RepID=UPI003D696585
MINRLFLCLGVLFTVISVAAQNQFLDPTFGTNGVVTYTPNPTYRFAYETGVFTSQQKLVVSGSYYNNPSNSQSTTNVIQRLNADGTIDNTFNTVLIPASSSNPLSRLLRMNIQNDQKILLGDLLGNKLVRLNENGTYDMGFGTNGVVSNSNLSTFFNNLGITGPFNFNNVFLTSTNKILVCTTAIDDQIGKLAVFRLNENGSVDTGFGNNGLILLEGDMGRLVVQNDSKLLLIGQKFGGAFVKSRYSQDGILDVTYNNTPVSYVPIQNYSTFFCTATGKDNNTYIYGLSSSAASPISLITLMKLNQDGELDSSFGVNGIVNEQYYNNNNNYYVDNNIIYPTLLLDNNNNLFLVCLATPTGSAADLNQFVKKFKTDGSVDQGFGNSGVVDIDLNGKEYMASAIMTPDQKVMIFGNYQIPLKGVITKVLNNTNALSVKNQEIKKDDVSIYPNPVKDILNVKNAKSKDLPIEIIDASGRSVLKTIINENKVDISHLEKGIYYLNIVNTTHKFIKE